MSIRKIPNVMLHAATVENLGHLGDWASIQTVALKREIGIKAVRASVIRLLASGLVERRYHRLENLHRGGLNWCYQYRRTTLGTLAMVPKHVPKARVEKVRPRPAQLPSYGVDWNFRSTSVE